MNTAQFHWQGRNDGNGFSHLRLHQHIKNIQNSNEISPNSIVIHGFCSDEGVRRNKGRVGAAEAPYYIRKNMANFPIHNPLQEIFDMGNINCAYQNLEEAQWQLSEKTSAILNKNAISLVLGGGHEITYAHYNGLKKAFPNQKIGIINFDAHWDNREIDPNIGATSGTGFWQIARENKLYSLHLGLQKNSNTPHLFQFAEEKGMDFISADDFTALNQKQIETKIDEFLSQIEVLYLSICMDVFNAAIAPGVSALAYNGLFTDAFFMHIYRRLLSNSKLKAIDVAEVNPLLDDHEKTARLAAFLMNEVLMMPPL